MLHKHNHSEILWINLVLHTHRCTDTLTLPLCGIKTVIMVQRVRPYTNTLQKKEVRQVRVLGKTEPIKHDERWEKKERHLIHYKNSSDDDSYYYKL